MLQIPDSVASQRKPRDEAIGTYLNKGRGLIEIDVVSKHGRDTTNIPLSPGRIARALIEDGQTKIYAPAEEMAKRRLLSSIPTPTPKTAAEFLEKNTRTFYFRIVAGKISLVRPRDLTTTERRHLREYIRELKRAGVYNNN